MDFGDARFSQATAGSRTEVYIPFRRAGVCAAGGKPYQYKRPLDQYIGTNVKRLSILPTFPKFRVSNIEIKNPRTMRDQSQRPHKALDFTQFRLAHDFAVHKSTPHDLVFTTLADGLEKISLLAEHADEEEAFAYFYIVKQGCAYEVFVEAGLGETAEKVYLDYAVVDNFFDDRTLRILDHRIIHVHPMGREQRGSLPLLAVSGQDVYAALDSAHYFHWRGSRQTTHFLIASPYGIQTITPVAAKISAARTRAGQTFEQFATAQVQDYRSWIQAEQMLHGGFLIEADSLAWFRRHPVFTANYRYRQSAYSALLKNFLQQAQIFSHVLATHPVDVFAQYSFAKQLAVLDQINTAINAMQDLLEDDNKTRQLPEAYLKAYQERFAVMQKIAWAYTSYLKSVEH